MIYDVVLCVYYRSYTYHSYSYLIYGALLEIQSNFKYKNDLIIYTNAPINRDLIGRLNE